MTRQDLIIAVLENLIAFGVGETPSAEDMATVGARIDGQLAQLARRGIIYIAPGTTEFDDELQDPLAVIVANACAPAYGQAKNPASVLEAENALREMQTGDGAGTGHTKSLYF